MHDTVSNQEQPHKENKLVSAGRIGIIVLLLLALIVIAVACSPILQIQITRGAAQAAMIEFGEVAVQAAGKEMPAASPEDDAPAMPEATLADPHESQVRLAAPMEVENTPQPTATITPTATPTPIPPASFPPTRLVIPSVGIDAPVQVAGWFTDPNTGMAYWETPADAAGFHQDSALPGWAGNTVLSGHHNIDGKVFEHLHEIQPGDTITLYVDAVAYHYQVIDNFIVPERDASEEQRRQNAAWIAPTDDERLTLVTCWPANDNSHRVIVVARPT